MEWELTPRAAAGKGLNRDRNITRAKKEAKWVL